jgi:hypothetical protein
MTDAELDALEKLAAAATPGPWTIQFTTMSTRVYGPPESFVCGMPAIDDPTVEPDAHFIAAAREAVPALIAEVRRLRKLVR